MKYLLLLVGLVSLGVGVFEPHHYSALILGGGGVSLLALGIIALGLKPSEFYEDDAPTDGGLSEDDDPHLDKD